VLNDATRVIRVQFLTLAGGPCSTWATSGSATVLTMPHKFVYIHVLHSVLLLPPKQDEKKLDLPVGVK
jgi:hypothetical protein